MPGKITTVVARLRRIIHSLNDRAGYHADAQSSDGKGGAA